MTFSSRQTEQLNERTKRFEQKTGAEIVVTIREKSDHYPEIFWKAFACGVGVGAILDIARWIFLYHQWSFDWPILDVAVILGFGAVSAAASLIWKPYARLFLERLRAEGEVLQCAKDLFLERELFKTDQRIGILILMSLFERQVVILPDGGFGDRLEAECLKDVIAKMTPHLRQGDCFQSILTGLDSLEAILLDAGFKRRVGAPDQIQDEIVQGEESEK